MGAGPCLHSGGRVRTRNPARRRHDGHGAFCGEFLGERREWGTPRASASPRGLRARRAAAPQAAERRVYGPGLPGRVPAGHGSPATASSGPATARGARASSAAREPRRGLLRAGGAGRGQSADGACAASGAGSRAPGRSASRGAGRGPRAQSVHRRTGSALPLGRAAGLVGLRPGLCLQACSQSPWKLGFADLPRSPRTPLVSSPSSFVQLLLADNGKYASAMNRKVTCLLRYLG